MDNSDRALLEQLISKGVFDVPLEMTHGLKEFGARLVKGEPGVIELSFQVPETTTQGNGVVSGGALTTMLDYAMAYAVLSKLKYGKTCATTSITVNMQAAAEPSLMRVVGTVDRVGRQVAFARSEIYDVKDRLIANSSATFFVMDVVSG
ncbi:PaaI family thioesterase [Pseudomonas sp. MMS21-TM103]|uniref:PaaI family thioesterase n=1 Tax=Pseudomonas sp. MMS21 TM103 TaxID=2886506 RepID=UPI001EDF7CBE|nr:PaaI family thioesterase [Pseudomonas sp. MMS21 TM103]MCG4454923.1 PaaI family thioesterase [Pseudomonas sp. MMS21 TM103]